MATNVFRTYTPGTTEEWEVPASTLAGEVVINNTDSRVGVTLTARGDATTSLTLPNGQIISNYPVGGVGNKPDTAVVATDGDFLFEVTGVTAGETVGSAQTGTPQGTAVYAVVAAGAVTSLTLTSTSNTKIGVIADGNIIGTLAPVSIGVTL
jgi:hypothetical protein